MLALYRNASNYVAEKTKAGGKESSKEINKSEFCFFTSHHLYISKLPDFLALAYPSWSCTSKDSFFVQTAFWVLGGMFRLIDLRGRYSERSQYAY